LVTRYGSVDIGDQVWKCWHWWPGMKVLTLVIKYGSTVATNSFFLLSSVISIEGFVITWSVMAVNHSLLSVVNMKVFSSLNRYMEAQFSFIQHVKIWPLILISQQNMWENLHVYFKILYLIPAFLNQFQWFPIKLIFS